MNPYPAKTTHSRSDTLARLWSGLVFSACLSTACVSYEPWPLEPEAALARTVAEFESGHDEPLSMASAVTWLLRHNERVVLARNAWQAQEAVADVGTPLANPSLSGGPVFFTGNTSLSSAHQAVESAIGWLLPLSGSRGLADELARVEARAAERAAVAVAREEYLALRGDLLAVVLLAERRVTEATLADLQQQIVDGQRKLGARATTTAIELAILDLELHAERDALAAAEIADLSERGVLANRCGVAPARVGDLPTTARPPLPESIPELEALRKLLIEHPNLVELQVAYETAEKRLRLAVRRQYPDLQFGGGYEKENAVERYGLVIGIDLPIFDRNQKGIAAADADRRARRQAYEARLRHQQGVLFVARETLEKQRERFQTITTKVGRSAALLQATMRAGREARSLSVFDQARALRALGRAQLSALTAKSDLYAAWLALEQACGAPLLRFPGEPTAPDRAEVR